MTFLKNLIASINIETQTEKINEIKDSLLFEEIKRDIWIINNIFNEFSNIKSFKYAIIYEDHEASFSLKSKDIKTKSGDFFHSITLKRAFDNKLAESFLFQALQNKTITQEKLEFLLKEAMGDKFYAKFEKNLLNELMGETANTNKVKVKI